jgi:hypothetical protein
MMENFYCEPVKGNVLRFKVLGEDDGGYILDVPLIGQVSVSKGSLLDGDVGDGLQLGRLWPETEEWKAKYQESLSRKVSQQQAQVYMVMPIKRGKYNSRVLVIDDEGLTYHGLVPTVPLPVLGQELCFLRIELTPVSLVPAWDILEKVKGER